MVILNGEYSIYVKVFNVASNSYEDIDVLQGVDFAMNAAKILEKTLSDSAVYIAGLYYKSVMKNNQIETTRYCSIP